MTGEGASGAPGPHLGPEPTPGPALNPGPAPVPGARESPSPGPDPLRHALSPQRHDEVYRDVIAPQVLVGTPAERPTVTVLGGQPGSGKSNIARALLGDRDLVKISSDTFRELHPKWPELLRADDTTAGFYTHHDARAWVETAIGDAVDRRLDVLFDTAQDDPERTRRLLNRFREAGYQVDVVFVAGGSALSRLGVLERYHTDRAAQGGARFVENPDRSFPGVLASARVIDEEQLADSVTVYRRDGTALYRNDLGADGSWTGPTGTDTALRTERGRPWTADESEWFTATAERLSKVKPEELGTSIQPRWHGLVADAVAAAQPHAAPTVGDRLTALRSALEAPQSAPAAHPGHPGLSAAAAQRSTPPDPASPGPRPGPATAPPGAAPPRPGPPSPPGNPGGPPPPRPSR